MCTAFTCISACLVFRSEDDPWMDAAADCLECLPEGEEMLDQALQLEKTDMTQRLRIFQLIADHYASLEEPLWSEKFLDLHLALLNLLMQVSHWNKEYLVTSLS